MKFLIKNNISQELAKEIAILLAVSVIIYLISSRYDILEEIVSFSRSHENLEVD